MPKQVVEHVLHADVFLNDATYFVAIHRDDELLKTYGFYSLAEYDIESGILYRVRRFLIADGRSPSSYSARLYSEDGNEETRYVYDNVEQIYIKEAKAKAKAKAKKSN